MKLITKIGASNMTFDKKEAFMKKFFIIEEATITVRRFVEADITSAPAAAETIALPSTEAKTILLPAPAAEEIIALPAHKAAETIALPALPSTEAKTILLPAPAAEEILALPAPAAAEAILLPAPAEEEILALPAHKAEESSTPANAAKKAPRKSFLQHMQEWRKNILAFMVRMIAFLCEGYIGLIKGMMRHKKVVALTLVVALLLSGVLMPLRAAGFVRGNFDDVNIVETDDDDIVENLATLIVALNSIKSITVFTAPTPWLPPVLGVFTHPGATTSIGTTPFATSPSTLPGTIPGTIPGASATSAQGASLLASLHLWHGTQLARDDSIEFN